MRCDLEFSSLSWDMGRMLIHICTGVGFEHFTHVRGFFERYILNYVRSGVYSNGNMNTLEALHRRGLVECDFELELVSDCECEFLFDRGICLPNEFCVVAKNINPTETGRAVYSAHLLQTQMKEKDLE